MTSGGQRTGKVSGEEASTEERASERRLRVRPAITVNDTDVAKLHLETWLSFTTILRWAAGFAVYRTTGIRLQRAMAKLGIPLVQREELRSGPSLANATPRRRRVVTTSDRAA
jgi:hypothetical protein